MTFRDLIPWLSRSRGAPARIGGNEVFANPMLALHRDIERAFDQFWNEFAGPLERREGFGYATPVVDISETDKAIEVTAELPGLSEQDIDLEITGDALTIRGEKRDERKEKRKGIYLSERSYGAFHRSIALPPGVDTDKADANFANGVLTVTLPKSPEAQQQVKRIEVKRAS